MPSYAPTTIAFSESGLIRDRQAFVTPNDAYVDLVNAYIWRGILKRKLGHQFLGRLRRELEEEVNQVDGATPMSYTPLGVGVQTIALFTVYGVNALEPNANLEPGSAADNLVVTLDAGGANNTILTDATDRDWETSN